MTQELRKTSCGLYILRPQIDLKDTLVLVTILQYKNYVYSYSRGNKYALLSMSIPDKKVFRLKQWKIHPKEFEAIRSQLEDIKKEVYNVG